MKPSSSDAKLGDGSAFVTNRDSLQGRLTNTTMAAPIPPSVQGVTMKKEPEREMRGKRASGSADGLLRRPEQTPQVETPFQRWLYDLDRISAIFVDQGEEAAWAHIAERFLEEGLAIGLKIL